MGEWLGLGTGATSHLNRKHFTTTSSLKDFLAGNYIDEKKTEILTETDYLKEKFIMGMRTMEGVQLTNS